MAANSYDQYIGDEVVLPDRNIDKLMGRVRKHFRYNATIIGEGNYNVMHEKSLYEF